MVNSFRPNVFLKKLGLPVIIVEDNETTITTSKGNLVAVVVPPVGMRLSVDNIAENHHVPNRGIRQSDLTLMRR